MSDSPESVVRKFYSAWSDPKADELGSFFHDTAIWVDDPQGVRDGAEAIKSELTTQLTAVGGVRVDVTTLLSSGTTVMVSRSAMPASAVRPYPQLSWRCSSSMTTGESCSGVRHMT